MATLPVALWGRGIAGTLGGGALGGHPRRAENLLIDREGADWRLTPVPFDPDGPVFHLNDAAAFVWRNADGRHSAADIAQSLSRAYGISTRRAGVDALACLESLARLGLVLQ